MIDTLHGAVETVIASWGNQLGGTFVAPGSSYSLVALAASLLAFVAVALPRGRHVRLRVMRRALFPKRLWRSASGRADAAFFVLGILFSGLLIGWALFSAEQVRGLAGSLLGAAPAPWLPGWLRAGLATLTLFLAYEFAYWLDHWLMHRVPLLWHFHKVHHQAESLSLLTNSRVHPIETIGFFNLVALVSGCAAALLDRTIGAFSPLTIGGANLLLMLTAILVTHLQHSHLWVRFGPFWGRLLLGPAHHQIHHSADPAHFNKNMGSSLALFDRLFGTFHMPEARRERLRFGVDDGETAPHGARAAMVTPVTSAAAHLLRGLWPGRFGRPARQQPAIGHPVGNTVGPVA